MKHQADKERVDPNKCVNIKLLPLTTQTRTLSTNTIEEKLLVTSKHAEKLSNYILIGEFSLSDLKTLCFLPQEGLLQIFIPKRYEVSKINYCKFIFIKQKEFDMPSSTKRNFIYGSHIGKVSVLLQPSMSIFPGLRHGIHDIVDELPRSFNIPQYFENGSSFNKHQPINQFGGFPYKWPSFNSSIDDSYTMLIQLDLSVFFGNERNSISTIWIKKCDLLSHNFTSIVYIEQS